MTTHSVLLLLLLFFLPQTAHGIDMNDIPIIARSKEQIHKRRGRLAICAIFRDEAPFMKEWIEYHLLMGASHFYLYNNLSQDNYEEILTPYLASGVVELFDVPFDPYANVEEGKIHNFNEAQTCCYNHALKLANRVNKWLAVIDTDEFICPVVDQTVTEALNRYEYANGLVVYWQNYGTSNVWDLEPGELMIEKLLYKEPLRNVALFKSIVRPDVAVCLDPHLAVPKKGPFIAPNHQSFSHTPGFTVLPIDHIRINHYTFRTASFYHQFKLPRRARWGDCPNAEEIQQRIDYHNTVFDPIMLRFVPRLKNRMFGK